jgi:release factor glutamine methyltransferase
LNSVEFENLKSATILDIGTGSGCIPIAIKRNAASCNVYSVDISKAALEVARQNCILNEVEINLIEGDILDAKFEIPEIKFDVIVSNPPYVRLSEKEEMSEHVLEHEPHEALFVSDDDPLVFYRYIAEFSSSNLLPGGSVFLEINESLGKETELLLQEFGFKTQLRRDLQGKNRMIRAIK